MNDALASIRQHTSEGRAVSVALCANAADVLPELVARGVRPDFVTRIRRPAELAYWPGGALPNRVVRNGIDTCT